jgi:hypothetical protein
MTKTLEFVWTTSRARDSYGYNVCTLYADGKKVARCNGGGYDMKGTDLGDYIARAYADRLMKLRPEDMEEHKHFERAEKPRMICENAACVVSNIHANGAGEDNENYLLPPGTEKCPKCGGPTRVDHRDGKVVSEGRYFYGLSFHDPNFDPGKAVIGTDCDDRTMTNNGEAKGKTVEQAEKDGETIGLERYQAFYRASSKVPTERHTVPLIDGACGFSSVERIMKAIGLSLRYVPTRSKKSTIYTLIDDGDPKAEKERAA